MLIYSQKPKLTPIQKLLHITKTITIPTFLTLVLIPATIALINDFQPTGTYLNPSPQGTLAQQVPTPTLTQSTTQLTDSSRAYLEKAINLSKQEGTTEEIIANLNASLQQVNQALTIDPNYAQAYLLRADIMTASTNLRPGTTQLVQADLHSAELISTGQIISTAKKIPLLDVPKTTTDPIIAAPNTADSTTTESDSNVVKKTTTFPKGLDEYILKDTDILPDSYIYLIPEQKITLFITSKQEGRATISTTSPLKESLDFEYWIVN